MVYVNLCGYLKPTVLSVMLLYLIFYFRPITLVPRSIGKSLRNVVFNMALMCRATWKAVLYVLCFFFCLYGFVLFFTSHVSHGIWKLQVRVFYYIGVLEKLHSFFCSIFHVTNLKTAFLDIIFVAFHFY